MAITIQQAPEILQPVYNPLAHVITSTNYTQPNFRYVCDIYINGGSTYIERQKIPPDPTYGSCVFDPSRVLENYVTKDFDKDNVGSFNCANSTLTYIIKYGEEYGLSSSGTTVYPNLTVQSKKYAWNGILDFEEYTNASFSNYMSGSSNSKLLTNAPTNKTVYIDTTYLSGNEFLYGINASSGSIYYLHIDTYDSSDNLIGIYLLENTYQALSNDNQKMVGFPVGYNLNSATVTVLSGNATPINANVSYYDAYFVNYAGQIRSESKRYVIDRSCSKYPLYEIYFMNKLGGYDTFVFNMKSNFKSDIERKSYRKNLGQLSSATTFSYAASQRGNTNYATNIDDTITLRSDFVSEENYEWLEELVTSPDVYMLSQELNDNIPVTIVNSSFERKQTINEKLLSLTIDIKLSYKRKRQRG